MTFMSKLKSGARKVFWYGLFICIIFLFLGWLAGYAPASSTAMVIAAV